MRRSVRGLSLAACAAAMAAPAWAHGDEAHRAHLASGWTFDPLVTALLLLSTTFYLAGLFRMGRARPAVAPPWRIACYAMAVVVLVLALLSPLDGRADASFAWHMSQHLLLMIVAAPLLALSNVQLVSLFAFPLPWRRRLGRWVGGVPGVKPGASDRRGPWIAAACLTAGLWLWHAPVLYETALANGTVHTAEHLTFLVTAAVFWRMVTTAGGRRLDLGSSVVLVTLVGLQGNLMAALITLAPAPLYASYGGGGGLLDQQIAGLIMWVPAGFIYLASTVWALSRLMRTATVAQPPISVT